MASFSLQPFPIPTFSFSSFLPKKTQISKAIKQNHHFVPRVQASNSKDRRPPQLKFCKRDLVIVLGGLYASSTLYKHPFAMASPVFPAVLDKSITTVVSRPRKSRSKTEKEDEEEVLLIDGIEFDKDTAVKFDVYINDEEDSPTGPNKTQCAGSFVNVPHKHRREKKKKTCLKLGITDLLDELGVDDDDSVVVTLVPRYGIGLATIGGIKITFLS